MSKVIASLSISLGGFVADCNDGVDDVFDWYATSLMDGRDSTSTVHLESKSICIP